MLKPFRSDQETSEEELFIKTQQKSQQNLFYWDLMLKLDKFSTQAVSIENYEIRLFRSNYTHTPTYLCKVSFLTTLDIYKDYFRGRHRWCKNNTCRKCPSSSFSLKKLLHLYDKGFVTKELPNLHCWWNEKLCSQHLPQVNGVSHVLGSVHH